ELALALHERDAAEVTAVDEQEVEGEVDQGRSVLAPERVAELAERGAPVGLDPAQLAVDERARAVEGLRGKHELRHARGPVEAVAAGARPLVTPDAALQPIAVELDLVDPLVALGRRV